MRRNEYRDYAFGRLCDFLEYSHALLKMAEIIFVYYILRYAVFHLAYVHGIV